MASLLAMSALAGAPSAFARNAQPYQPSVTISAAPPVVDTGSQAYPSSPTGAGAGANHVVAGGPLVTLSGGESMPQSVNSAPPGFFAR